MNPTLFVLVAMVTLTLTAAASQRFITSSPKYMVPTTRNACHQPIPSPPLIMNGKTYQAFSICTSGRLRLHPNSRHNERDHVYPTVSPYYATASNAQCKGSCILYGQTTHTSVLDHVKGIVNDQDFNPQSVIWVQYLNLYKFICLRTQQTNTFEVVLATDSSRVTYTIFIYRNMSWDRLCQSCNLPVVGYEDGNNLGYSYRYTLPNTSAASHLSHSIKVFRISDKVTTNIQEVRKQEVTDQEVIQALREILHKKAKLQEERIPHAMADESQEADAERRDYELVDLMGDERVEEEEYRRDM